MNEMKWTLILRCHQCNGKFTLRRLGVDRLFVIPQITPCPHCGARPQIADGRGSGAPSKRHRVFDLIPETQATYRKGLGDTWHFSPACSNWPSTDYVELEMTPAGGELCNECKSTRPRRNR